MLKPLHNFAQYFCLHIWKEKISLYIERHIPSQFMIIYLRYFTDFHVHLGLAELKCWREGDAALCDRSQSPKGARHRLEQKNCSRVSEPVLSDPELSHTGPGHPADTACSNVQRRREGEWYFTSYTYMNTSAVWMYCLMHSLILTLCISKDLLITSSAYHNGSNSEVL